jgi:hypothetical protein
MLRKFCEAFVNFGTLPEGFRCRAFGTLHRKIGIFFTDILYFCHFYSTISKVPEIGNIGKKRWGKILGLALEVGLPKAIG